jgi:hypothetical protein
MIKFAIIPVFIVDCSSGIKRWKITSRRVCVCTPPYIDFHHDMIIPIILIRPGVTYILGRQCKTHRQSGSDLESPSRVCPPAYDTKYFAKIYSILIGLSQSGVGRDNRACIHTDTVLVYVSVVTVLRSQNIISHHWHK